jgi:hypothetical protein
MASISDLCPFRIFGRVKDFSPIMDKLQIYFRLRQRIVALVATGRFLIV